MRRAGGAIVVWAAAAAVLGVLTAHVRDWFVMTDELLYERLALSVARAHSPLPQVHGTGISNANQLYAVVLAPVIDHGAIGDAVRNAHVLNAVLFTSAAVPAYLLARRYVTDAWAVFAAALCVVVPWTVLSSFLLSGSLAYPLAVWALFACVVAIERASPVHDVLAVLTIVLAIGARTQLVVLALVLPLAILVRREHARHRPLGVAYGLGVVVLLALVATGHGPLGSYASTAHGNVLPAGTAGAFFTHIAAVGIGLVLLPVLVGGGWLIGEARRNAFALVGLLTVVLLALEVASYDERFGGGLARDRYVSYLAPVFAIAFVVALARREARLWPCAAAGGALGLGLVLSPLPLFDKLNVDAPVAVLDNYLHAQLGGLAGARTFLAAALVVGAGAVALVWLLVPRRWQAVLLAVPVLVLTTAETGYAFARLFRVDGTPGRPVTTDPSPVLAWVDPLVHGASVASIPFPVITGDYWSSAAYWWDLEFWNRSVDRTAGVPGEFEWTPSTFPKVPLGFDAHGRASATLAPYVVQAVADTRFHLRGTVVTNNRNAFLVRAEEPWRADWSTAGLYDDGWTRPGTPGSILVYPYPGQDRPVTRTVDVSLFAPPRVTSRPFTLTSNLGRWNNAAGGDEVTQEATVCVGPAGPARVTLRVKGASPAPGNPRTDLTVAEPRRAGAQVARIYLSGAVGPDC